jgi:hypothetical protein
MYDETQRPIRSKRLLQQLGLHLGLQRYGDDRPAEYRRLADTDGWVLQEEDKEYEEKQKPEAPGCHSASRFGRPVRERHLMNRFTSSRLLVLCREQAAEQLD